MQFQKWNKYYKQILKEFNFSKKEDEYSAKILSELLKNKKLAKLSELKKLIFGKEVAIVGTAIKKSEIKKLKNANYCIISADNSTTFLLKENILPDIITTDLDGIVENQIKANEKGSLVIVHAHGDNINAIKKYTPQFNGKIIGTTQSTPFNKIYNFGGFTDGDRAVFLAKHFLAEKIFLFGFNFKKVVDKENKEIKLRKLKWAEKLINLLLQE